MTFKKLALGLLVINILGVIVAIITGMIFGEGPDDYFGEGDLITWISVVQLAVIGIIAYKTGKRRGGYRGKSFWRSEAAVWAIVAAGFVYLAVDEKKEFHEDLDKGFHEAFEIEEDNLTDRIDDLLMGLMGLAGVGVLVFYRKEIKRYPEGIRYLVIGFTLMFMMVILDTATNRDDLLLMVFDEAFVEIIEPWLAVVEDSFKIFAEAFFMLGFYTAFVKSEQLGPVQDPEIPTT